MRSALHAEWTKLRTTRSAGWLLLAIIAATVAVTAVATTAISCPTGVCPVDGPKISLTGVQLGQAVVAILGVLMISGEYSTGMIVSTLTAMPRRVTLLAAKGLILVGVVGPASIGAVLGALLTGWLTLPAALVWPGAGTLARVAIGSVLYLTLIALMSLGVATAVRDPAAAVGIVLGLLYLFPIIATAFSDPVWRRHLDQIGPMTAGLAIQATVDLESLPLSPWTGLGVLAGWAAGALVVGGLLLRWRDA